MTASFEREWDLAELLPPGERERAGAAFAALLGSDFAILDPAGEPVWGKLAPGAIREALVVELEPIGYVAAALPPPQVKAAAGLVRQLLAARSRYLLAASCHTEAVNADYEALRASEARYKALSEALEQRVKEQVALIEAQQRQLYVAEKFASVGQLAAGVAHEINNPVGFIRSNLRTLGSYLDQFAQIQADFSRAEETWQSLELDYALADGKELLSDCIEGTDRIGRIVRDLKGFSNVDRPAEEIIDVSECVRRAVALVAPHVPSGVELEVDLDSLPPRRCQPWQLAEALYNILNNAVQAVAGSGRIGISSRAADGQLIIEIRDNGTGIPPDRLDRVFDPFYTTREVGQGTGLGLTVSRDIVQAHGGTIAISSQPGQGTCVTVSLLK